ncbi:TonB-dependent receptor [Sphingobacterium sp. PCS056]|uniref:SusC/RagA family TonB-linked outer membrane protein n=1 Tax=Sphingobacterium sp. PCS056 TaxID=2931400 RepID=UPI00200E0116|nr:TonB-dependent receptor [Sphingobacterium sp. PCS056]UPZ38618.1 TonB-dependent receptor [Sphingobacterium sp. PCS056]
MRRIVFTLLFLGCLLSTVYAQDIPLSGKITNNKGLPLSDVTVTVMGTQHVTASDENGNYKINATKGTQIRYTRVGKKIVYVTVGEQRVVNVVMDEGENLDEVVVTGYQTQRKADLTGAVAVVKMDEINAPLTGNVMKSLQGRVPGAFITTSGSPDGSANVLIRGIGTLGNNSPLYIIDGMPSTKSMNEISGLDIESIQILKDASSSSIYGSRAANGVIIITTKKGGKGSTRVDARVSTGIKNYAKSLDWLDTQQRGRVQWQAARDDGTDPNFGVYTFKDVQNSDGSWQLNEIIVPEYIDDAKTMRAANTDWVQEVGQTALVQNYNVSLMTGNDKSRALFSVDYFDNQGTVKGTYFERLSGRLNTDFNLLEGRVKIGENLSITKIKQDVLGNVLDRTRNIQPIVPVHTVDGMGWGGPVAGMSDRQNPVRLIADNEQNRRNMLRLFGDMYIEVKLLENLKFRSMLGMDYSFLWDRNMQKTYVSGFMSENTASLNNVNNRWGNYVWNNTLTYKWILNEKHHFDFLAGQELIDYYAENLQAGRRKFASEDPDYMYLDAGEGIQTNSGSGTAYRLLSYFGKVNYNLADKYLLSATARYDGSSRFGANNQFGWFPALSAGWRLSQEDFLKSVDVISDLKIRYGWGKVGNQEIGDFASYGMYQASYATNPTWDPDNGTAYDINGAGTGTLPSGYRRVQQPNPNLRWESATQHNIGVDFGFFNQKLTGSFDYFKKNTSDILISPPFIATLGEGGNRWVNGASMSNRGYEFLLSYSSSHNHWKYSVTGNMAGYRNKIVKLPEDVINSYPGNGVDQTILGRPLNSMFGYVADGLFRTMEEVNAHAEQVGKGLGRIRYQDINQDGRIGDEDRTWLGIADPDFIYGVNFSVGYKQWDVSMFWNGVYGGLVNNSAKGYTDFISFFGGENYGTRVLDAWSPQNSQSDIPALSFNDLNNEKRFSSYFVESASYFKLRTLELGYSLSSSVLKRIKSQGVRFYVLGENLLAFKKSWGNYKYTGVDPETPNSGYPIPFSITAGINVSF